VGVCINRIGTVGTNGKNSQHKNLTQLHQIAVNQGH
jgi:hypothetical protein